MPLIYSCLLSFLRINWDLFFLPLNYTLILIKSDLDKLGWVANHTRRSVPYSITKCLCLIKPIANSIACLHNRRNTIVFFGAG